MKASRTRKDPEIVMRGGKPTAGILSIEEYRKLLEQAKDVQDLKTLKAIRKRPQKFRNLDGFIKDSADGPPSGKIAMKRKAKLSTSKEFSAPVGRKTARMHGTPVYIWKNGKVVAVKP